MSIDSKIIMITGANSGIGKATAIGLADMGATIIMVCRDKTRGENAQKEIIEKTGNHKVDLLLCNLASFQSIRNLISEFKKKYQYLHVLINNAGVMLSKRELSDDGFEMNFAVNHLAPFLLTHLLLDVLKKSAPSRIINVASAAHKFGTIDLEDLQAENKKSRFMGLYADSKLALMLTSYEFNRRLEGTGVTLNTVHPGMVNSNLGVDRDKPRRGIARRFFKSPEKGAETSIYLASSPDVEAINGKYFIKKQEQKSSEETYDTELAKKLWAISMKLVGLS
jgi:NAD(P)-dependent dehydrogenase (short-subunit alcohol dehydrogenase family)